MFNKLKKKLFGEWKTISSAEGVLAVTNPIIDRDYSTQVIVVIQQNSKTKEKRAYYEKLNGDKISMSVHHAEKYIKRYKRLDID